MSNTQGRNTLKEVVDFLTDIKFIVHTFSFGKVKFQGLYNYKYAEEGSNEDNLTVRKLDVRWVPFESIWSSILHSTGSDASNVRLRKLALEKGMTLSEFGLFDLKTREPIPIESEEDIFEKLGTKYLLPEERD
jgi:DNA polymerase/3'-5' exonuclease PolX